MPKFLVLIHDNEALLSKASSDELSSTQMSHMKFAQAHGPMIRGGGRLAPSVDSVTLVDGEVTDASPVQDGPIAMTGFYILEADTEQKAIEAASQLPCDYSGCVQVRGLLD